MKIVALLPMKANSERVKGKNFKNFSGKPLFQWILDTLKTIPEINQIVINTDARKILSENGLIEQKNILIRDRDPSICGDHVSMNLVIKDDIENVSADLYLMTHTTNPLLSKESIQTAISKYRNSLTNDTADSLFTVNKVQDRFYDNSAKPLNHDPKKLVRTQDLKPWYLENSNLYLFTNNSFKKSNARIGLRPIMLETPHFESIDIDTPEDWVFGEAIVSYYKEKGLLK